MGKIVVYYNDVNAPYGEMVSLLHNAFQERLDAGLNFGCATYNAETFREKTQNSYIVTIREDVGLVAIGVLTIHTNGKGKFGITEYMGVRNDYKRKGYASQVLAERIKIAHELGLDYVISTTATTATSSVRYHLKNGFKIFKVFSNPERSYKSYGFIIPIKKRKLMNCCVFRKCYYFISWIKMQYERVSINKGN